MDRPAGELTTEDEQTLQRARAGIREHRCRKVTLRLVDRQGEPIAGLPVQMVQQRHAFAWGDQVWTLDAHHRQGTDRSEEARSFRRRFVEVFNAATNLCYWTERPANDASKTEDQLGEPRYDNFAATVDWTLSRGMIAKGHPLFWTVPKAVPQWMSRYDVDTQWKFAEVRVRSLVSRFRGRVTMWDVVNEALWEPPLKDLPRREWPWVSPIGEAADDIEKVLRWCRDEDPDATFLINDYGLTGDESKTLTGHDGSQVTPGSQRGRYLQLARELADRGVAPDAIGLQSHTGGVTPSMQWRIYDEMAQLGLPLHITEYWARLPQGLPTSGPERDEAEQRRVRQVTDYLTTAFGHPAIGGFFFWGLMNFAIDWAPKGGGHEVGPLFDAVRQLLREQWYTTAQATTDAQGCVSLDGFLGDYALRYRDGAGDAAVRRGVHFSLDRKAGDTLTLQLQQSGDVTDA